MMFLRFFPDGGAVDGKAALLGENALAKVAPSEPRKRDRRFIILGHPRHEELSMPNN